ncbi:MAG: hypothetical protein PHR92_11050 [Lachnospiraceae bacterium]|nr:hypothetical protein [Lachnospiraceae bacterium]
MKNCTRPYGEVALERMKNRYEKTRHRNERFKGEENTAYHDIIAFFKIYSSVNWKMQIKINQDLSSEKERIAYAWLYKVYTFLGITPFCCCEPQKVWGYIKKAK